MAKKPKVNTPAPTAHVATGAAPPVQPGQKDPCRHRRNKKKKQKFVVYYGEEKGGTGNFYVGRTRGQGTVDQVTNNRWNSHHRTDIKRISAQCVTDSYSACRGAEQKHYNHLKAQGAVITGPKKPGQGAQIAPISDDNPKKADYIACAEATARASPNGCPICAA